MSFGSNAKLDISGSQNINEVGEMSNKIRLEGGLSW